MASAVNFAHRGHKVDAAFLRLGPLALCLLNEIVVILQEVEAPSHQSYITISLAPFVNIGITQAHQDQHHKCEK
jgi:hypothetical protein